MKNIPQNITILDVQRKMTAYYNDEPLPNGTVYEYERTDIIIIYYVVLKGKRMSDAIQQKKDENKTQYQDRLRRLKPHFERVFKAISQKIFPFVETDLSCGLCKRQLINTWDKHID